MAILPYLVSAGLRQHVATLDPQAHVEILLTQVQGVLEEYEAYLPLTVRQVFYRLVGAHSFEKATQAYSRLSEMLNRARRAQLIDMDAIATMVALASSQTIGKTPTSFSGASAMRPRTSASTGRRARQHGLS